MIFVDIDPDPQRMEQMQRLLFCGMTRATVRLEMVVRAGNPLNDPFLKEAK